MRRWIISWTRANSRGNKRRITVFGAFPLAHALLQARARISNATANVGGAHLFTNNWKQAKERGAFTHPLTQSTNHQPTQPPTHPLALSFAAAAGVAAVALLLACKCLPIAWLHLLLDAGSMWCMWQLLSPVGGRTATKTKLKKKKGKARTDRHANCCFMKLK